MNLSNAARSQLSKIPGLNQAIDFICARANVAFGAQHDNESGAHANVTTQGCAVSGAFATNGWQAVAMTGSVNNVLMAAVANVLEVRPNGAVTITGMTGGFAGRRIVIINSKISVDAVTLALNDTGSLVLNRFCGNGAIGGDTIVVESGRAVDVIYRADNAGGKEGGWHVMVKA